MTLLGDIAAKIADIDRQLAQLDDQAHAAVEQIAVDGPLGDTLRRGTRAHFRSAEAKLQKDRDHALEQRDELKQERAELRRRIASATQYLADHADDEARIREVLALLDRAFGMLRSDTEYEARDRFRDVKGAIYLPGKMEQARANLRGAERRLAVIGEE